MTGGGYRSLARLTAPSVKDVSTIKRDGGRVDVILLSRDGNGTVPSPVVTEVYKAFQDDEATQLTDVISVRSASITTYSVSLTLRVRRGPDPQAVKIAAEAQVRAGSGSRGARFVFECMASTLGNVSGRDVRSATRTIPRRGPGWHVANPATRAWASVLPFARPFSSVHQR